MAQLIEAKCCSKCWHGTPAKSGGEQLCPDLVACMTEGPNCHEDGACKTQREERIAELRRLTLTHPVIFVGTGTCGLAAGAGKTMAAIKRYLAE